MGRRGQIGLMRRHGELTVTRDVLLFTPRPAETRGQPEEPPWERPRGSVGYLRLVHGVGFGRLLEWNSTHRRWDHLFGGFAWWSLRAELLGAGWETDAIAQIRWRRRRRPPADG